MRNFNAVIFLFCSCLMAATASADTLYAVASDNLNNTYGTLDTDTGVFTPISSQTLVDIYGMGFTPNGTLYGTSADSSSVVYQIDPLTGGLTSVGSINESTIGSTVGPDGLIYAVSQDLSGVFFSVDPTTLAVNVINASLGFGSNGLAVFANGFFYTNSGNSLVQLNPTTGAETVIGNGLGTILTTGVNDNGTIYAASGFGDLYTIDLSTGVATEDIAITGTGDAVIDALAIQAAVPEPSTIWMSGIALLGLIAACRRKA